MDDSKIIELFFARSQQAIVELSAKYEKLLLRIAMNILNDHEDAAECVNDTYLGTWNAIPPQRPNPLISFVCRIARNISLKKYRSNTAQKRNCSFTVSMEELKDCLPSPCAEEIWSARELGIRINHFLDTLDKENRLIFLRRYWFADSVKDISALLGISENNVSAKLSRIRIRLKDYLIKEGFRL